MSYTIVSDEKMMGLAQARATTNSREDRELRERCIDAALGLHANHIGEVISNAERIYAFVKGETK